MRKIFFILLLLVLPIQAVWAAASSYCQHEQGAATSHFGHHAHAHKVAMKGDSGGGAASTFHADCAFCHLGAFGSATLARDLIMPMSDLTNASHVESPYLSICLEGPERPKWVAAV